MTKKYLLTFDRVGRGNHGLTIEIEADDVDDLEMRTHRTVRPHLNSKEFSVDIHPDTLQGFIDGGRFGKFTCIEVGG